MAALLMTDQFELLANCFDRARRGDRGAQDQLFRELVTPLTSMIRRRLGPGARMWVETGDILSETLLELCRTLPQFEGDTLDELLRLALHVCRHKILDAVRYAHGDRRDARRTVDLADVSEREAALTSDDPSPSQILVGAELKDRLREALESLTARERALIVLRRDAGASPEELGELLGISPDAARMALRRASRKLYSKIRLDPNSDPEREDRP